MIRKFVIGLGVFFTLSASASFQEEIKMIHTYLADPEVGKKLYGDNGFEVLEGGLTTYSQIVLEEDYYHIVGVPFGLYSFNNVFTTHFQLHDISHLNSSIPTVVAEEWVKKSINGKYQSYIVRNIDSVSVYVQSYEPIENLLNPTSNYKDADILKSN